MSMLYNTLLASVSSLYTPHLLPKLSATQLASFPTWWHLYKDHSVVICRAGTPAKELAAR